MYMALSVHVIPLLHKLHWLPVRFQSQFKVLVVTYKDLHCMGPGYQRDHFPPIMVTHSIRSSRNVHILWPIHQGMPSGKTLQESLSCHGAQHFPRVKLATTLLAFLKALKDLVVSLSLGIQIYNRAHAMVVLIYWLVVLALALLLIMYVSFLLFLAPVIHPVMNLKSAAI